MMMKIMSKVKKIIIIAQNEEGLSRYKIVDESLSKYELIGILEEAKRHIQLREEKEHKSFLKKDRPIKYEDQNLDEGLDD